DGISVLLGIGDGTFRDAGGVPISGGEAASIHLADMNGDGRLDVVMDYVIFSQESQMSQTIEIALGNGDGTFQTPISYPAGAVQVNPSLGLVDFNSDGNLDVAITGNTQDHRSLQTTL